MEKGFYTALGTPTKENGEFCAESMARQIHQQIEAGASGLLVMGSMGKATYIKNSEYAKIARVSAEAAQGRVPVLVGVTDLCIERVRDRYESICDIPGIDGIVSTVPYYATVTQNDIFTFYNEIANFSKLPVYLYDLPVVTKSPTAAATVQKLWKNPNIRGIKSGNLALHRTLMRCEARPADFVQMYSNIDTFDIAYGYGINKNLDGMFSCAPATSKRMYDALAKGDQAKASAALDEILALRDYFASTGTLMQIYSYAMNLLGCEGNFGMDYQTAPTEEHKATVAAMLKKMGEI